MTSFSVPLEVSVTVLTVTNGPVVYLAICKLINLSPRNNVYLQGRYRFPFLDRNNGQIFVEVIAVSQVND